MEEDVVIANLDADQHKDLAEKWVILIIIFVSSIKFNISIVKITAQTECTLSTSAKNKYIKEITSNIENLPNVNVLYHAGME